MSGFLYDYSGFNKPILLSPVLQLKAFRLGLHPEWIFQDS